MIDHSSLELLFEAFELFTLGGIGFGFANRNAFGFRRNKGYSDALDLPSMRKLVAAHRHDDDWLDADIWVHQARLDMQRDGTCQLGVEPVDD
jgi:hypothetical protein